MTVPTPSERRMFSDLTRLLADLHGASLQDVYEEIEKRYRRFLAGDRQRGGGELQITLTWSLPEGADGLALYRTEYRTAASDPLPAPPDRSREPQPSAQIIAFPQR